MKVKEKNKLLIDKVHKLKKQLREQYIGIQLLQKQIENEKN